MLDPIVNFFVRVFNLIGQGIGWVIAFFLWPFVAFGRWYQKRGWVLKSLFGLIILAIITRYVFNKPAFYADYANWGDGLKEHVVERVQDTYLSNKTRFRTQMFGMHS